MPITRRQFLRATPVFPAVYSRPLKGVPAQVPSTAPRIAQSARSFRIGCLSEPRTLNPFFAGDHVATSIASRLYETILGRWEDAPRPWLAELRDPANIQQIELDLNLDAQWQDGTPVTMDDLLMSLSAAQKLGRSDDTWQIGDQQGGYLRIELDVANAFFVPDVLRKLSVLPQKIWGGIPPDDWPGAPQGQGGNPDDLLGSGQYRFETWDHGHSLRLVRSPTFWGELPEIRKSWSGGSFPVWKSLWLPGVPEN